MATHLNFETTRYTISSTLEVPLTVDATDWVSALCTALDLLERAERVPHLVCEVDGAGVVTAHDPDTGEVYSLKAHSVAGRFAA